MRAAVEAVGAEQTVAAIRDELGARGMLRPQARVRAAGADGVHVQGHPEQGRATQGHAQDLPAALQHRAVHLHEPGAAEVLVQRRAAPVRHARRLAAAPRQQCRCGAVVLRGEEGAERTPARRAEVELRHAVLEKADAAAAEVDGDADDVPVGERGHLADLLAEQAHRPRPARAATAPGDRLLVVLGLDVEPRLRAADADEQGVVDWLPDAHCEVPHPLRHHGADRAAPPADVATLRRRQ
mmetsp:Transcript_58783/g.165864  ORF Transcript_58783/g.165864 Transcript_58783/m.165864 type:complete len:240 (-) Transcript_58783:743-1462(-)